MNNFNILKAGGLQLGVDSFDSGRGRIFFYLSDIGLTRDAQFFKRSLKEVSANVDLLELPAKWGRSVQLVKDSKPRELQISEKFRAALLDALSNAAAGSPLDRKLAQYVKFAAEHAEAVATALKSQPGRQARSI